MITTIKKAWAVAVQPDWTALDSRKVLSELTKAHLINSWLTVINTF
jgi:hypothetical protein